MIKAIETQYKGYRFRSRLEARWAVYLDAMGVRWYYEHEGYELASGWYLPDFYLPELKLHLEVKPDGICQHASSFRDQVGAIVVTMGMPGDGLVAYCWDYTDSSGGSSDWHECEFGYNENREFCLFINAGRRDREFCINETESTDRIVRGIPKNNLTTDLAINRARSARFDNRR